MWWSVADILCQVIGHKWKWMGRAGMSDTEPGHLVYECERCGMTCREKEDTGKRETWY